MQSFIHYLNEAQEKTVAFTFGRFQPPTIGHEKLLKAVETHARGSDFFIYVSQSVDKKDNLLPWKKKLDLLGMMFPRYKKNLVHNNMIRTFLDAAVSLNNKGYKNLIMVVGSDRVEKFEKLLNQYNGTDYKFDSIEVVSAGERDPDADGEEGASASKAREAARKGDFKAFSKLMPKTLPETEQRALYDLYAGK